MVVVEELIEASECVVIATSCVFGFPQTSMDSEVVEELLFLLLLVLEEGGIGGREQQEDQAER